MTEPVTLSRSNFPSPYNPGRLLTSLQQQLNLKSDAALSHTLHISRGLIYQMRNCTQPVAGAVLILIQEVSQLSLEDLRGLMGDRRSKCRMPVRINQEKTWPRVKTRR